MNNQRTDFSPGVNKLDRAQYKKENQENQENQESQFDKLFSEEIAHFLSLFASKTYLVLNNNDILLLLSGTLSGEDNESKPQSKDFSNILKQMIEYNQFSLNPLENNRVRDKAIEKISDLILEEQPQEIIENIQKGLQKQIKKDREAIDELNENISKKLQEYHEYKKDEETSANNEKEKDEIMSFLHVYYSSHNVLQSNIELKELFFKKLMI